MELRASRIWGRCFCTGLSLSPFACCGGDLAGLMVGLWAPSRRYDRQKLTLKDVHNCQYVACMNPTSGSFTIDPRLQVSRKGHPESAVLATRRQLSCVEWQGERQNIPGL